MDIRVKISNARIPSRWDDLEYRVIRNHKLDYIEFSQPVNAAHFLLEVCGSAHEKLNASFHIAPSLDTAQILALLQEKTIVFLGCARNCEAQIDDSISTLVRIGELHQSFKIVIFENDSSDRTAKILQKYAALGTIEFITKSDLDASFPLRTQRLAYARNLLLNRALVLNPDYFCMADLDGVVGAEFNLDGYLSNFACEKSWDAVFPANRDFYYDIWALRHPEICPKDFMVLINQLSPGFKTEDAYDLFWKNINKIDFKNMRAWLAVDSAFGGMGVYKLASFRYAQYFGLENGQETCEHVAFHQKAVCHGARLYINPKFIVNSH